MSERASEPSAGGTPVEVEQHDGWAEVRLNQPERRNALSQAMADGLLDALAGVAAEGCTAAVLGAAGPVFCAGGDVDELRQGRAAPIRQVVEGMAALSLLVIARVEGPVLGAGLALLTPCPVVLCSPAARFVLPAAERLDVFPAGFFPYLGPDVPARRLLDVALSARPVAPDEAVALGLATAVADGAEMDAEVRRWLDLALDRPGATAGALAFWRDRLWPG